MEKRTTFIIAILIVVVIIIGFFIFANKPQLEIITDPEGITPDNCVALGGEVINILEDSRADDLEFRRDHITQFCKSQEDFLDNVVGLHCPCICCKK
jgi:hypothetical protein